MKPANISLKKYRIQVIVSPATFFATEYGKGAQFEMKSKILQRDVKPFDRMHEISIGQIVAVKCENGFHRGLITDTYNRCKKPVYGVWLMDNDSNIEVSADSVYLIKTSELRNKKLSTSEITLYGVQPGTIDLLIRSINLENTDRNNLNGILHIRESDKWSPAAFKFVKELFKSNKCIYVQCVDTSGSRIVGNIYYEQEGHDTMMSLAQTLCDKNFAVFSRSREKIPILDDFGDGEYLGSIERRIPEVRKNMEWEELYSQQRVARNNSSSGNLSSYSESSKSSCSDQEKFLNDLKEEASTSCSSFSPSPILKKVKADSSSASSVSFTSSYQNSEEKESSVTAPKICLLRIIQRNLELYKKHNLEC